MKQSNLTFQVSEEKLNALKMYMGKKGTDLEEELAKAFEKMYVHFVPGLVREYINDTEEPDTAAHKRTVKGEAAHEK